MTNFIKTQQEVAREILHSELGVSTRTWTPGQGKPPIIYELNDAQLDYFISRLLTNTGAELLRLAEGRRDNKLYGFPVIVNEDPQPSEEYAKAFLLGHNQAIDTLKKHITSVTGVKNLLDDNK